MTQSADCDVLIIGTGAAGLSLALELADQASVMILSKAALDACNTQYAQGGISAVLSEEDSLASHVEDTLNAGAGLCDPDIVNFTVSQGPERIAWLIEQGVPFTQVSDSNGHIHYHLTREGGHSHRRVIHAEDATGRAIISTLSAKINAHSNIHVNEYQLAIDLVTGPKLGLSTPRCLGAYVLMPVLLYWLQVARVKLICIRATQMWQRVMVLLWHGGWAVVWRIWSLFNFIRLVYIIPMRNLF